MIFTIIGALVILRWRHDLWWLLGWYVLAGVLYMFASGWGAGSLRTFMVGVWYNDPYRLAALLPAVTLPLVVLGFDEFLRYLGGLLRQLSLRVSSRTNGFSAAGFARASVAVATIGMLVVVSMAGLFSQSGTLSGGKQRISEIFKLSEERGLLTRDEFDVLKKVPELVPEDALIVVNPFTGASLAYALSDRRVIAPHMFGDRTEDEQFLIDHWDEAAFNPEVCKIATDLNALWALDFGSDTVISTEQRYLGLDDLQFDIAPGIEVLYQRGDARLVRLSVCDS